MNIKELFLTESEYLDFAWKFLNPEKDNVWREEDRPLLEPFFEASQKPAKDIEWTDEIKKSFDYYQKCRLDYADKNFEIRDCSSQFDRQELLDFFFLKSIDDECFDVDDEGNDLDSDGNIIMPFSRELLELNPEFEAANLFPMIFVGMIDSTFDRLGNMRISFSDFVSLSEFKHIKANQKLVKSPIEPNAFSPHWPDGLKTRKPYKFSCDDCCTSEDIKELSVLVSDDGDVWLSMMEVNDIHTSQPFRNTHPTVRCRTGIGGGRHRRTRQALLWLARAIQLDNEELGIKD